MPRSNHQTTSKTDGGFLLSAKRRVQSRVFGESGYSKASLCAKVDCNGLKNDRNDFEAFHPLSKLHFVGAIAHERNLVFVHPKKVILR